MSQTIRIDERIYEPPVDIYEIAGHLIVEVELPGVDPEDIRIELSDELLVVEGRIKPAVRDTGIRYICMERDFQAFRRRLRLPVAVDASTGRAMYSKGILTVRFSKKASGIINRITIMIEED